MMKNKKTLLLALSGITLVVASFLVFFLPQKSNNSWQLPESQEDNYVNDEQQPLVEEGVDSNNDKTLTPSNPPATDSASSPEKPRVTRAEHTQDLIRVSAIFEQASSGQCVLTLTRAGYATVEKSVGIIVGASYYTCNGFRFPSAELSSGDWSAVVTHKQGDRSSASDPIIINVR